MKNVNATDQVYDRFVQDIYHKYKCGVSTIITDNNGMKYTNLSKVLILLASVVAVSCGKDGGSSGDNTITTVETPIQITAEIHRTLRDDGYTELLYFVNIKENGLKARATQVTVNGTILPTGVGGPEDYAYELREYSTTKPTYVPGLTYTVSVLYKGTTYTETEKAPGDITASADFTKIQWTYSSKYTTLDVSHLFGSTTYSTQNLPLNPKVLNSPQTIPSTAFPSAGTYTIVFWLQNIKDKSFGNLSGNYCYLNINDSRAWRIIK